MGCGASNPQRPTEPFDPPAVAAPAKVADDGAGVGSGMLDAGMLDGSAAGRLVEVPDAEQMLAEAMEARQRASELEIISKDLEENAARYQSCTLSDVTALAEEAASQVARIHLPGTAPPRRVSWADDGEGHACARGADAGGDGEEAQEDEGEGSREKAKKEKKKKKKKGGDRAEEGGEADGGEEPEGSGDSKKKHTKKQKHRKGEDEDEGAEAEDGAEGADGSVDGKKHKKKKKKHKDGEGADEGAAADEEEAEEEGAKEKKRKKKKKKKEGQAEQGGEVDEEG